jgi:YcxB-like protein
MKVVDGKSQLTDFKTLEFGPTHLVLIGSDWKNEMPWTQFKGFSEDDTYFYLHLNRTGIATIIPKSAFSSEQQHLFRKYGQTRNA